MSYVAIHIHKIYSHILHNRVVTIIFSTASCRNVVDLSTSAHKDGALTTTTNPAYEMMKPGGGGEGGGGGGDGAQGSHEYELVGVSPGTMPSPPSRQPLPTIPLSVAPPTGVGVGVAKEREEEGVYDNIPGDQ